MATSQRRYKATLPTEPAWPAQKRSQDRTLRRKAAGRRRGFAMLVVVPVLLMLGSVYLNTLAAEKLGMHEPKSTTLKVYGARAEDGKNDGAPQEGGRPRQR